MYEIEAYKHYETISASSFEEFPLARAWVEGPSPPHPFPPLTYIKMMTPILPRSLQTAERNPSGSALQSGYIG
jgi:hypothetical protein